MNIYKQFVPVQWKLLYRSSKCEYLLSDQCFQKKKKNQGPIQLNVLILGFVIYTYVTLVQWLRKHLMTADQWRWGKLLLFCDTQVWFEPVTSNFGIFSEFNQFWIWCPMGSWNQAWNLTEWNLMVPRFDMARFFLYKLVVGDSPLTVIQARNRESRFNFADQAKKVNFFEEC